MCYDFKVKKIIHVAIDVKTKNFDKNIQVQLNELNETRFYYWQKAVDAISYVDIISKIRYDSMHVFFLLKSKNKAFLKLHHEYFLFEKHNRKFFNQKIDSFFIKRRVKRFAYEFKLFSRWRIHSIISMTQLKSKLKNVDFYNRFRFNHSEKIEVRNILNTSWLKSYEIKKLINKRIKNYEKRQIIQYLLRWKDYKFEYDKWKLFTALNNFINVVKNYEGIHLVDFSSTKRTLKKSKDKEFKIIVFIINSSFAENNDNKINVKLQIFV